MAITITIDGTDKTGAVLVSGCTIEDRLAGRGVLRLSVIDKSASPSYRPGILKAITIADGGTTLFGGLIQSVEEEPIAPPKRGILSRLTAYDYSAYADRVVASVTYAATRADKSIKAIVSDLRTTYLNQFGVTLDGGMATGPDITGEVKFDYCTVTDALNHVCALTGWVWYINASKVLKCHAPSAVATPVTLTSANATVRACTWAQDVGQYRNRQIVRYQGGVEIANNAGQQSTYGLVEQLVEAPDVADATTAATLAAGLLRKYDSLPKRVTVDTFETGFAAGQQGTITVTERNVSGAHLVQAVTRTYVPTGASSYRWRTRLEAVEGDEQAGSWVDLWRAMVGVGLTAASGGALAGGLVVPSGTSAFSAFLGGSRNIGVAHTAVVDVPEYADVLIDSARFPAGVTAKVQVRTASAGTSVKPQVWMMTGTPTLAGEGSATTATSWEDQSFAITLTSGLKAYRLRLVPSNSSNVVYGTGALYA